MSSPAVELGACQPLDAVGAIRERRRSRGAPSRSTATACWSARPARGDPSTRSVPIRKAPRQRRGQKVTKGHRIPAKLPRTANRLLRSLRRQTKLSAETPPGVSAGFTATGCQAQFLLLAEKHTFANAPGFQDEVPASPLLAQLPMDFGRIVLSVKPYSPGLPLSCSARTVPTVAVPREVPHLDCSYCAIQHHCLHTSLAFRLPLGFPRPMFHSGWGTQVVLHRRRTMAQCLWLYGTPQRLLLEAVTGLSYPLTPDFSRCRYRQLSP